MSVDAFNRDDTYQKIDVNTMLRSNHFQELIILIYIYVNKRTRFMSEVFSIQAVA